MSVTLKKDSWKIKDGNGTYRDSAIFSTTLPEDAAAIVVEATSAIDAQQIRANDIVDTATSEIDTIVQRVNDLVDTGTDTTLTQAGAAADAAACGELKSAIKLTANIAADTTWTNGSCIVYSTGRTSSSENLRRSGWIDVTGINVLLYMRLQTSGSSTPINGIAFYTDSNPDSFISGSGVASDFGAADIGGGYLYYAKVPAEAKYVRFTWWKNNVETIQFVAYDAQKYNNQINIIAESLKEILDYVDLNYQLQLNATIENGIIASNGQITIAASRSSYEFANDDYPMIEVTAGPNGSHIAFLKESIHGLSNNDPVIFAGDEHARHTIAANTTESFFVPDDCAYIVIANFGATATLAPKGGCVYTKSAVTCKIKDIAEDVDIISKEVIKRFYEFDDVPWRMNSKLNDNHVREDNNSWAITDCMPIEYGDEVKFTGALEDSGNNRLVCFVYEYNSNLTLQKRTQVTFIDADEPVNVIMGSNTKFIRFMFGYADEETALTKEKCNIYFSAETTRTAEELSRPSLNILFIGNSKAYDSVSYAPAVLKSLGVDVNINIGIIYHGGQGLEEHYKNFVADTPDWCTLTESVNLTKWRNVLGGGGQNYVCSGLDCFTYRKWDVISFQQATTKAGNYNYFKPWLNGIIEYINDNVDYKWKMAWNNVDTTSAGCDPDEPNYNADKMPIDATEASHEITEEHYDMVISALQDMLAENPVEIVFPVATATQNARNTSLASLGDNGQLLYDWKHAQEGIPCLIEGYTIAIKLMELLGIHNKSVLNDRTVVDSNFLSTWAIQGQHGEPVGFEDETTGDANRKIAQKCAILACQRPMELSNIVTALPTNYPDPYPTL